MKDQGSILINAHDLITKLNKDDTIILDCSFYLDDPARGRKEYLAKHIEGAVYMDLNHDLSSPVIKGVTGRHPLPHPEILMYTLRSAGINNSSHVISYDQSNGVYASRMWWLLRWLGHHNNSVLDGGMNSWKGPIDNQWYLPAQGNFTGHADHTMVIRKEQVKTTNQTIIDSREFKRYSGEIEPIDPIAGHIPGAICIPYLDNVGPDGEWKSKEELLQGFEGIESQSGTPVFYCGSGVTACHNVLAYKIATGKDSQLYAGSWSEWINYYPPA